MWAHKSLSSLYGWQTVNYFNTGLHFYLKEDKPVVLFLTRSMVLVGTQDGGGHPVMMAPKSPCSSTWATIRIDIVIAWQGKASHRQPILGYQKEWLTQWEKRGTLNWNGGPWKQYKRRRKVPFLFYSWKPNSLTKT